jgi:hypothetical protein
MQSETYKPFMLNVIMLSVMAPNGKKFSGLSHKY